MFFAGLADESDGPPRRLGMDTFAPSRNNTRASEYGGNGEYGHRVDRALDNSDIEGARAARKFEYRDGSNIKEDIPGTRARPRISEYEKRATNDLAGIEGSRPARPFFRTDRIVDTMNPSYDSLGEVRIAVEEPRFVRDAMAIDDIDGTRAKPAAARERAADSLDPVRKDEFRNWKVDPGQTREQRRATMDISDINSRGPQGSGAQTPTCFTRMKSRVQAEGGYGAVASPDARERQTSPMRGQMATALDAKRETNRVFDADTSHKNSALCFDNARTKVIEDKRRADLVSRVVGGGSDGSGSSPPGRRSDNLKFASTGIFVKEEDDNAAVARKVVAEMVTEKNKRTSAAAARPQSAPLQGSRTTHQAENANHRVVESMMFPSERYNDLRARGGTPEVFARVKEVYGAAPITSGSPARPQSPTRGDNNQQNRGPVPNASNLISGAYAPGANTPIVVKKTNGGGTEANTRPKEPSKVDVFAQAKVVTEGTEKYVQVAQTLTPFERARQVVAQEEGYSSPTGAQSANRPPTPSWAPTSFSAPKWSKDVLSQASALSNPPPTPDWAPTSFSKPDWGNMGTGPSQQHQQQQQQQQSRSSPQQQYREQQQMQQQRAASGVMKTSSSTNVFERSKTVAFSDGEGNAAKGKSESQTRKPAASKGSPAPSQDVFSRQKAVSVDESQTVTPMQQKNSKAARFSRPETPDWAPTSFSQPQWDSAVEERAQSEKQKALLFNKTPQQQQQQQQQRGGASRPETPDWAPTSFSKPQWDSAVEQRVQRSQSSSEKAQRSKSPEKLSVFDRMKQEVVASETSSPSKSGPSNSNGNSSSAGNVGGKKQKRPETPDWAPTSFSQPQWPSTVVAASKTGNIFDQARQKASDYQPPQPQRSPSPERKNVFDRQKDWASEVRVKDTVVAEIKEEKEQIRQKTQKEPTVAHVIVDEIRREKEAEKKKRDEQNSALMRELDGGSSRGRSRPTSAPVSGARRDPALAFAVQKTVQENAYRANNQDVHNERIEYRPSQNQNQNQQGQGQNQRQRPQSAAPAPRSRASDAANRGDSVGALFRDASSPAANAAYYDSGAGMRSGHNQGVDMRTMFASGNHNNNTNYNNNSTKNAAVNGTGPLTRSTSMHPGTPPSQMKRDWTSGSVPSKRERRPMSARNVWDEQSRVQDIRAVHALP